jgi:putative NADH-flavin reductase
MRVVIFGSTGGTGKQLIARGLERGHHVVAVARRPESITVKHERLTVMKGDVLDAASVAAAVQGADAVISAIGPADNKTPGTLMSDGTRNMLAGCATAGAKRFIFESGLMVGDGRGLSFFGRSAVAFFGWLNSKLRDDKRIAEAAITASGLDWVIVRPPVLAEGAPTGKFVCAVDAAISPAKKLSFPDVADCLLDVTANASLSRVVLTVGHT